MIAAAAHASKFELAGAAAFGGVIGWYLYYVNRYRSDAIRATDLLTTITALGGGAILRLFPARSELFGAYGIGLFAGFFSYFAVLIVFVVRSPRFTLAWFLDGRAPSLGGGEERPAKQHPMEHGPNVLAG